VGLLDSPQPLWLKTGWMHASSPCSGPCLPTTGSGYRLMGVILRQGTCALVAGKLRASNESPPFDAGVSVDCLVWCSRASFPTGGATWFLGGPGVADGPASIQFYARWRRLRGGAGRPLAVVDEKWRVAGLLREHPLCAVLRGVEPSSCPGRLNFSLSQHLCSDGSLAPRFWRQAIELGLEHFGLRHRSANQQPGPGRRCGVTWIGVGPGWRTVPSFGARRRSAACWRGGLAACVGLGFDPGHAALAPYLAGRRRWLRGPAGPVAVCRSVSTPRPVWLWLAPRRPLSPPLPALIRAAAEPLDLTESRSLLRIRAVSPLGRLSTGLAQRSPVTLRIGPALHKFAVQIPMG